MASSTPNQKRPMPIEPLDDAAPDLSGLAILVLDSDKAFVDMMKTSLESFGAEVINATTTEKAKAAFVKHAIAAVIASNSLLTEDRNAFINGFKALHPNGRFYVVIMPGEHECEGDPSACPADDYLIKPVNAERLARTLASAKSTALAAVDPLINKARPYFHFRSPAMRLALESLPKVAASDHTVLIMGETGTGKEIISRGIHVMSTRADGPFIAVNCGAIPETLIEGELFGHEKGAFTGADRMRKGKFEMAHNGTLFLDEIGEMPMHLQVRLLRALEERQIYRVGAERPISVDVRVIAATRRDLKEAVQKGMFREDLYYRLNVLRVQLPPLNERKEDISSLAVFFIDRALSEMGAHPPYPGLSTAAIEMLERQPWRGNVRELRNVMTRVALFLPQDAAQILPSHIIPHLETEESRPASGPYGPAMPQPEQSGVVAIPQGTLLKDAEMMLMEAALKKHKGNRVRAAKELGIGIRTLRRRLNE